MQNEKKVELQTNSDQQMTPTKNLSKIQAIDSTFEQGFGLIRIKEGNTFKIPISALEGKNLFLNLFYFEDNYNSLFF